MEHGVDETIKIGVSACLLGQPVRYDGGHKHDRYITDILGRFFTFVPVCPEVECGLSVPREAMRLIGDPAAPRLVTVRSGVDLTEQMNNWAEKRVTELENEDLCGFIFKSKSPSSGMERVKVYDPNGVPRSAGIGLFARKLMERLPLLPVEEEGRLNDLLLRENFIESVFVFRRWRTARAEATPAALVGFHTSHKLLLRSHSEQHYRELGRLAAQAGNSEPTELFNAYQESLLAALKLKPTVKKHCNVLLHMMGYFKKVLSGDEKQELLEVIDRFRSLHVPLIVPLTLFNHHIRKYREPYLQRQVYLNPHPLELKLRKHA